jgi:hypothetical protein
MSMSRIETIQILLRSDKIRDTTMIRLVRLQNKLIKKYSQKQRKTILDKLPYIEPRDLTRREIDTLIESVYRPKKIDPTHSYDPDRPDSPILTFKKSSP